MGPSGGCQRRSQETSDGHTNKMTTKQKYMGKPEGKTDLIARAREGVVAKMGLLWSLRALFTERNMTRDEDFLATEEILSALNSNKEAPWADFRDGEGLSAKKLSESLRPFKIKPVQLQHTKVRTRGYKFGAIRSVFERYLKS